MPTHEMFPSERKDQEAQRTNKKRMSARHEEQGDMPVLEGMWGLDGA